ncbi:Ras-related GTP-binding protein A [Vanrija pseudolonga]|uniref:GTP-binding protein n=1 Tax=Vanrija pseudolonga TaxID=143232 RepID=A0AAF0Y8C7_9TREE|nr:Ras-related GTP-binding protein A [Vanrija pseudolonga]
MSSASRRKVLLMGKSGSGKTSMRSVIFSNYTAKDTRRLGATIDVEQSAVRLLGSLVLNLWDCGGQDAFLDNYLVAQRDTIFTNVAVLIYVFDITSSEWEKDVHYFEDNLQALRENSADAGIWVLINKMDLVDKEDPKRLMYAERRAEILAMNERLSAGVDNAGPCRIFPTSIWDESLYKAWSSVIHYLIPNIKLITEHLTYFRDLTKAAEVAVFEGETFLVMAKSGSPLDAAEVELDEWESERGVGRLDRQRFEKVSEIIKSFRRTCQRTGEQFLGFEADFDGCVVVLEPLTRNTFMLVITTDPRLTASMVKYNISQSTIHFVEVGLTVSTFHRKCSICRDTVKKYMPHAVYDVEGDDDPNVVAWDDVPVESDVKPANGTGSHTPASQS